MVRYEKMNVITGYQHVSEALTLVASSELARDTEIGTRASDHSNCEDAGTNNRTCL